MSDDQERQLQEALDRMEATRLGAYQGRDISERIRRLIARQSEVRRQLQAVVEELDEVAALLREQEDRPITPAINARNQIATDFTQGAQAVKQAREDLIKATKELEYLRYRLL